MESRPPVPEMCRILMRGEATEKKDKMHLTDVPQNPFQNTFLADMQKAADMTDISVLFFPRQC